MNAGHLTTICYLIIHTKIPIIHHQDIKNVKHFSFKLSKKLHWFDKSLLKYRQKLSRTIFGHINTVPKYLGFNHLF